VLTIIICRKFWCFVCELVRGPFVETQRKSLLLPPTFPCFHINLWIIIMNKRILRWVIPVVLSRYKYVKKILFFTVTKHN